MSDWITSNVPAGGYLPGETYTITVTVSGNGKKGFEVSPQDLEGNLLGVVKQGAGSKLVSGGSAVTQSSSSSANPKVWEFEWIAPEAGTGDVTFYGAFTINEPVTRTSTLKINENTGVGIDDKNIVNFKVYPNPARGVLYMEVMASGFESANISIHDMAGSAVMMDMAPELHPGINTIAIPLDHISPGVYFLSFSTLTEVTRRKILIF